jgi:hypothetical protein
MMIRGGGGRRRWLILSMALPVSAVVHTPKALFSKKVGMLRQRLAAVCVLQKLRWWRLAEALPLLRHADR